MTDKLLEAIDRMIERCDSDEERYRAFNPMLASQYSAMQDTLLHVKQLIIAEQERMVKELKALYIRPEPFRFEEIKSIFTGKEGDSDKQE